jgi:hypothetical protein
MATEYTIRPLLLSSLFLQMSAEGQKVEIFELHKKASALPLKADMSSVGIDVR